MSYQISIDNRKIGDGFPVYIIAELSGNHNQDFEEAKKLIKSAKDNGADAVKLQTYTPDTITINADKKYFRIKSDNPAWDGKTLYDLYQEAYTPWEWHEELIQYGQKIGITVFSTPFDHTAVDFLENLNVPAYKIASFEVTDLPLIRKIAETGKPIIMSTGLATLTELDETVRIIKKSGNELVLLHCVSAYPAPASEMNIRTIPHLKKTFDVPVGLSDHYLGIEISIASVALGACIIEKHFTLDRGIEGPDSAFSIEPHELSLLVNAVRNVWDALGKIKYGPRGGQEEKNIVYRKSIFAVKDISAGEKFTSENVRVIRPGFGLSPRYMEQVLQSQATKDISRGSPISWDMISG